MIGRGQGPRDGGLLDEALTSMATCAPEFGPGLSNHGPMAAEGLCIRSAHLAGVLVRMEILHKKGGPSDH